MMRSRSLSVLVAAATVVAGAFLPFTNSASAVSGGVPGAAWSVAGSDVLPVVSPNGDVMQQAACTGPSPLTRYARDGSTVWTTDGNSGRVPDCVPFIAADAAGNTYFEVHDSSSEYIQSLDAHGTVRWTTATPGWGPGRAGPALGWDSKVYFAQTNGYTSRVVSFDDATGTMGSPNSFGDATALYAYATGYAVVNAVDQVNYYGYNGSLQHQYSTGAAILQYLAFSSAQAADGGVFVAGYSSDCTLSVEKLTPSGLTWTWTESAPGSCASTAVAATPDGGVILSQQSDAMVTRSLDSGGSLRWSHTVGRLADGNPSFTGFPIADVNGVVAMPSSYLTGCSSYPYCDAYQIEFATQASAGAALPIFQLSNEGSNLALDTGRLYFIAYGYTSVDSKALSAFDQPGLGADYRLQVATPPAATPPPSPTPTPTPTPTNKLYAALGDSYSSGEGVSPYLAGTDQTSPTKDKCHRSNRAYGPLLDATDSLGDATFAACSGAVTLDLFNTNHSNATERGQISRIPTNATTVTLTIGGNDAGFSDTLHACTHMPPLLPHGYGCSTESTVTRPVNVRIAALEGSGSAMTPVGTAVVPIVKVLRKIHLQAPTAHIFIAGYPRLFGGSKADYRSSSNAPSGHVCRVYHSSTLTAAIDYKDAQWMNAEGMKLDAAIQSGTDAAAKLGLPVTYVSAVMTKFAGHGLCDTGTPWIFPLSLNVIHHAPNPWSFHPTTTGQKDGYEAAFLAAPGL